MEFKIENGPVFSTLKLLFKQGEQFRAEAGSMLAMSPTVELEAKTSGKGLGGMFKAAMGGESFFASLFTAKADGEVVLAPSTPGDILRIDLDGKSIFCEGGAYLAGSTNLEISTKGSLKGLISGEGLFLQKITGSGVVFLNAYGAIIEKSLAQGETYVVDTGHIVAFEESVQYKLKKVSKGFFNSIASGEGLVAEYSGPGKIWMQTHNLPAFAGLLSKLLPKH